MVRKHWSPGGKIFVFFSFWDGWATLIAPRGGLLMPIFKLILGAIFEEFWGAIKALFWVERP